MAQTTSFVEGSYDPFTVVPVKEKRGEELAANADLGLTLGVVANAQGSAYVEWNEAKLVAAVFGPRDRPGRAAPAAGGGAPGSVSISVRHAPFANGGRRTLFGSTSKPARLADDAAGTSAHVTERTQQAFLDEALTPFIDVSAFPKLAVDVAVTVLESAAPGGVLLGDGELEGGVSAFADGPALVAACAAALVDAGIPMRDFPCCALVAGTDAELVPSPTPAALLKAQASAAVVYAPHLERVAHLHTLGRWRLDDAGSPLSLHAAIEASIGECARLEATLRALLE